jgi:hypothetical protein
VRESAAAVTAHEIASMPPLCSVEHATKCFVTVRIARRADWIALGGRMQLLGIGRLHSKCRGESGFKPWITRMVVNCCLTQLRHRCARPQVRPASQLRRRVNRLSWR